jgi:phage terminase large subunit-like protein
MISAPSSAAADRAAVKRGGFAVFCELAQRHLYGRRYVHGKHVPIVADHVEALYRGDILTLLVSASPGSMKTDICSRLAPAWIWTEDPSYRFMRAGYDLGNTAGLAGDTRKLCQSEWYVERWGEFVFDRLPGRKSGEGEYWTLHDGFSMCGSVQGGRFTGRHAHMMIVDDPIKGQNTVDADPAILRQVRDWYRTVAVTRGAIGSEQRMLIVAQRFHEQDLNGLVLEQLEGDPLFAHVMLPWHYEPARAFSTPFGKDPRMVEGEELFADPKTRHAVKLLMSAGKDDPTYRAQYQQDPGSGKADVFPEEVFQPFTDSTPAFADTLSGIFVDPTLSGKNRSDFMAVDVWGFRDQKFMCFYSEWVRRDFSAALAAIKKIREDWPAPNVVIEATANGPALANMLELEGVQGVTLVTPQELAQKGATNDASKLGRARAASFYFRAQRCFFDHAAPWFAEKKRFMMRFPGTTHDDMVDTAVMAVIWLQFTYGGGRLFEDAMHGLDKDAAKERAEDEQRERDRPTGVAGQMRGAMRELLEGSKHPVALEGSIALNYGMLDEAAPW